MVPLERSGVQEVPLVVTSNEEIVRMMEGGNGNNFRALDMVPEKAPLSRARKE